MAIFKKGESSLKISKKIEELEKQLVGIEAQLKDKQAAVEAAISSGGNVDKLFVEIGSLEGNVSARQGIISKLQSELEAAQARETKTSRLLELARFEKLIIAGFTEIEKDLSDFISAVGRLSGMDSAIRSKFVNLIGIPPVAGVDPKRTLRGFDLGEFYLALNANAPRHPVTSPALALEKAEGRILGLFADERDGVIRWIQTARAGIEES